MFCRDVYKAFFAEYGCNYDVATNIKINETGRIYEECMVFCKYCNCYYYCSCIK